MDNAIVPYNPQDAKNAYQRLQFSLNRESLNAAILEIKTFLKIFPDVAMASNDLGVLYYQTGEKLLALACYEKANRLEPGNPIIVKNLAEFHFVELGWTDDAVMMLTSLLKQSPKDCEVLAALGMISDRIGRENEARMFYRQVLDIDPDNSAVREALGRLEGPVCGAEYRQRPAPVPEPPRTEKQQESDGGQNSRLGDILSRLRSSISASQPSAAPVKAAVANTVDLHAEAQRHIAAGENEQAISSLESALALNQNDATALNDLGVLYTQAGDLREALGCHEKAVAKSPNNTTFAKNLAALYYAYLSRTDEAIEIYTRLLREYPNDIETLSALAIISKANNLKEQARTFIVKVLELEPWNADARDFLAELQ